MEWSPSGSMRSMRSWGKVPLRSGAERNGGGVGGKKNRQGLFVEIDGQVLEHDSSCGGPLSSVLLIRFEVVWFVFPLPLAWRRAVPSPVSGSFGTSRRGTIEECLRRAVPSPVFGSFGTSLRGTIVWGPLGVWGRRSRVPPGLQGGPGLWAGGGIGMIRPGALLSSLR